MLKLRLPFWLDGPELAKLKAAAQSWWEKVEGWMRWPSAAACQRRVPCHRAQRNQPRQRG